MKFETSRFVSADGTELHYAIWSPETLPTMVLQVTHGMTEHILRYEALARELTTYGIVVAGFDLRGHGENPSPHKAATMGKDGWENTLEDMHQFRWLLSKRFSGLPHYMMGFSLGAFLLREYLSRNEAPNGAILIGTGTQPAFLLSMLMKLVRKEADKYGFDNTTDLIWNLSFGTYNRKFKPNYSNYDWLCSDQAQLSAYRRDRFCKPTISAGLLYDLLASMKRTGGAHAYDHWYKKMPILIISGQDDPVGNMGAGVKRLLRDMGKAGMTDVRMHLLPNARHDVLHEEVTGAAREARDIIWRWIMNTNERKSKT